ncbi:MAG: DotU family type IV/VI secretion system protein [Desulfovibrio sp.]|jgi:type VI secretion system protein ImpK|nr:DotU family type IV/VI secretion system protein [Desulfovibrio sp.]
MPRTDWFNEAMITAMLAAGAEGADTGARDAQGPALTEGRPFTPAAGGARDVPGAAPDDAVTLTQAPNLRAHLLSLLDEARRLAVMDGFPPEYAETADFAVCAFIDETLLSSDWSGRTAWMTKPLQLERHDTGTAGEDFYRLLDDLLKKAGNGSAPGLPASGTLPGLPASGTLPGLTASGTLPGLPSSGTLPGLTRSTAQGGAAAPPASSPATGVRERGTADQAPEQLLEIFALCLAQGFTGMYFHDPDTVRSYLRKIGQLAPSVGTGAPSGDKALFSPAGAAPRASSSLLLRFDLLDWLLWLTPLGITAAIYYLCGSRLDDMLAGLLQRSTLP